MLLNRTGAKRLAVESVIALSLAWASLQLGQVYASEDQCAGLTALGGQAASVQTIFDSNCDRKTSSSE